MHVAAKCPRDGQTTEFEVHDARWRDVTIDACPQCGGAWFDSGEIGRISKDPEIERLLVDYAGGASDVRCPRDGTPLARRPVDAVTLDVCPKCHGVWADEGELESAARTLGGLEAERAFREGMTEDPIIGRGLPLGRAGRTQILALSAFRGPGFKHKLEKLRHEHYTKAANRLDKI